MGKPLALGESRPDGPLKTCGAGAAWPFGSAGVLGFDSVLSVDNVAVVDDDKGDSPPFVALGSVAAAVFVKVDDVDEEGITGVVAAG